MKATYVIHEVLDDRFMNPLVSTQSIPLVKEQTSLNKFK